MSGHSKWHNIQGRKGKQDALRSNQFSKISKLIIVAAKNGGDPAANFSLRLAIEKARVVGMPRDNIERAIKKGAGGAGEGAQIEEVLYECFGPNGVAVLVRALTDNKNRTVSDIKRIFSDAGGSMAGVGSVLWMFEKRGVIEVKSQKSKVHNGGDDNYNEELEMMLIEAGADDFEYMDDNFTILTKVDKLQKILNKLNESGVEVNDSKIEWVAKDKIQISEEVGAKLEKLFSALEENDDVDDYYVNAM